MTEKNRKNLIKMGMMIGRAKLSINIDNAENMDDFTAQLNAELNSNIKSGMNWESLFAELEKGINNSKFDDSMQIL